MRVDMNKLTKPSEIRRRYFREFGEYCNCDPNFPKKCTDGQNHVSFTKGLPRGFELCAQIAPTKNNITARICIRSTHMPAAYDSLRENTPEINNRLSKYLSELSIQPEWRRGVEGVLRLSLQVDLSEPSNWPNIFKHHLQMLQALRNILLPVES
jgi:hypothetical protein